MCCHHHHHCEVLNNYSGGDSGSLWITLLIGFVTIVATVYVVYLGKRVEISTNRFNKICLEPLESKFKNFNEFLDEHKTQEVSKYLMRVTNFNTDLNIFLIQMRNVYPKLDINKLQDISISFSDYAYSVSNEKISSIESEFLKTKIIILNEVYNYCLYSEVKYFFKPFQFKK